MADPQDDNHDPLDDYPTTDEIFDHIEEDETDW